jgi:hypothetical protein
MARIIAACRAEAPRHRHLSEGGACRAEARRSCQSEGGARRAEARHRRSGEGVALPKLRDRIKPGVQVLFVGINPGCDPR